MGRKSLKKDRAYLTTTEWANEWGGYKDRGQKPFRQLPFYCCAIAFTPFQDPACTDDGTTYEITNILPYIRKYHKHPVSGAPLGIRDIVPLHFHKNVEGQFCCPVLSKVFTAHTHIVAIKTSGNVFSWEAVEELNIKQKYWKDLLTDDSFTRKDIIHLQDPLNLSGKNVDEFDHVKHDRMLEAEDLDKDAAEEASSVKKEGMSEDMQRMLMKLQTPDAAKAFEQGGGGKNAEAARAKAEMLAKANAARRQSNKDASTSQSVPSDGKDPRLQPPTPEEKNPQFKPGAATWNTDDPSQAAPWVRSKMQKEMEAGSWRGKAKDGSQAARVTPNVLAQYREDTMRTTGAASRSLTSSAVSLNTKNQRKMVRVERNPKKKAYMQLQTSHGHLNLELHCDLAPRTCENFIALADSGYYKDTLFHRSIKNFMLQGGDPTGTGTGGESIYGPTFKDEVDSRLLHSGRGILSMANSGPHTNGSQFFILYKSAHHLDYKHTVFGQVVGGFETLTALERIETDDDDRPVQPITFLKANIFVNPYKEMEEAEMKQAEEERVQAEKQAGRIEEQSGTWFSNPGLESAKTASGTGVGKYLDVAAAPRATEIASRPAAKRQKGATYGNFDSW